MPRNVWEADIDLTAEAASRLIAAQFPELAPVMMEVLGIGWDNTAYLVNGQWVFRFPRRQMAVPLLEAETRFLPQLAPHLPLPIPVPRFVGTPTEAFVYPFVGYARLDGVPASDRAWTNAERTANAEVLAHFLAALHTLPTDGDAPGDTLRRADMVYRAPMVVERLRKLGPHLQTLGLDAEDFVAQVERLAAATPAWGGEACWCHGDLYARHLLANEAGRLCGVIDWGDLHRGDAAGDLGIAFSFLPPPGREAFRAAYEAVTGGPISGAAWDRARFRAIHYGAILTLYGAEVGDQAIQMAGEDALRFVSVDSG